MTDDPYIRLRPYVTPADELCTCEGRKTVSLMYDMTSNPLHCINCNLEIPPEEIELSSEIANGAANWNLIYGAFYTLWLDSKEWEQMAEEQMLDPKGRLVTQGLQIVEQLRETVTAYLCWFNEADNQFTTCPRCGGPTQELASEVMGLRRKCEGCHIVSLEIGVPDC